MLIKVFDSYCSLKTMFIRFTDSVSVNSKPNLKSGGAKISKNWGISWLVARENYEFYILSNTPKSILSFFLNNRIEAFYIETSIFGHL